jgi:hypothetical protein
MQTPSHPNEIDEQKKFTAALRQVLSAKPDTVRSSNVAAKADKFSSHTRFVPRPVKAHEPSR